jgi:hypothetical protein
MSSICEYYTLVLWPIAEGVCLDRLSLFTPHTFELGFFLHWPRFLSAAIRPDGDSTRDPSPSKSLLSAVCLWGSVFGGRDTRIQFDFFVQATSSSVVNAPDSRGADILDILQTEVLLSYYCLWSGRIIEATSHIGSAVALAGYARLNIFDNSTRSRAFLSRLCPMNLEHTVLDGVQPGEVVNAFWSVLVLQRTFAITVQANSTYGDMDSGVAPVDVPWPVDLDGPTSVYICLSYWFFFFFFFFFCSSF